MTTQIIPLLGIASPGYTPEPLRTITINATRDGQQTSEYKEAVLWASLYDRTELNIFVFRDGITSTRSFAASAVDGKRAIMIYDFDAQPYGTVRSLNINQDLELNIDLNDGTGGGSTEPTEPATAAAVVRVNKKPAARELFAVERRADGTYRFAGSTLISQSGDLEMQVTGGEVYAIAVDDFGIPYQAGLDLEVGQTVRPTHFQGWLYVCTEPGKLPSTEPEWWPEIGDNPARPVGTARLQATRYYQPIAHGPIHYELI